MFNLRELEEDGIANALQTSSARFGPTRRLLEHSSATAVNTVGRHTPFADIAAAALAIGPELHQQLGNCTVSWQTGTAC